MADAKLTSLAAITSISTDDIIYVVDDPGGTPVSKKITFDNLQKSISQLGGTAAALEIYFGDSATNGTWRIVVSSGTLSFQVREAGTYIEKGSITA
jgi:hypothetical protein